MRFLTWANDPDDPRCELLFKSAKHFGIEVEPIGVGKEYRGGVSKIEWLCDAMGRMPHGEEIVCTDAHDVLYVGEPVEDFNGDFDGEYEVVVFAGQRWYRHQDEQRKALYDEVELDTNSIYRYPDAGIVSGSARSLTSFYDRLKTDVAQNPGIPWEQWFVSRQAIVTSTCVIDYDCELFYCCGGEWRRFAGEVVDGRFRNKRTGTYPYILHAPIPRRSLPIRERVARELGII